MTKRMANPGTSSAAAEPWTSGGSAAGLAYTQGIAGCLDTAIGQAGLSAAELRSHAEALRPHIDRLKADYAARRLPILRISEDQDDIVACESALTALTRDAETVVFFGTGGSGLGGQALAQIAGWNIPGDGGPEARRGPRTRFYDNLDPRTLEKALDTLDLPRARFVVTSKSGGTPETLVQAVAAIGSLRRAGLENRVGSMFLGITEPAVPGKTNALRALLEPYGVPILDHHTGIGGRFSALTNVGLLPALSRAMDARALRAGARAVVDNLLRCDNPLAFAPAAGAALAFGLMRDRGIRTLVMLPYSDRLESFGAWYVQLWAESLGKNGQGSSPVAALGPVDQHSQLQLWMDGPKEHLITVVRVTQAGTGPRLEKDLAERAGLDILAGRTVGDLVDAQAAAIPDALAQAGRPVRVIDVDSLDERATGGLMMHFMIETILAAGLIGIDPFDQPAVELGKRLARERLARRS
jgi:glucose-6-phosphate isomerase